MISGNSSNIPHHDPVITSQEKNLKNVQVKANAAISELQKRTNTLSLWIKAFDDTTSSFTADQKKIEKSIKPLKKEIRTLSEKLKEKEYLLIRFEKQISQVKGQVVKVQAQLTKNSKYSGFTAKLRKTYFEYRLTKIVGEQDKVLNKIIAAKEDLITKIENIQANLVNKTKESAAAFDKELTGDIADFKNAKIEAILNKLGTKPEVWETRMKWWTQQVSIANDEIRAIREERIVNRLELNQFKEQFDISGKVEEYRKSEIEKLRATMSPKSSDKEIGAIHKKMSDLQKKKFSSHAEFELFKGLQDHVKLIEKPIDDVFAVKEGENSELTTHRLPITKALNEILVTEASFLQMVHLQQDRFDNWLAANMITKEEHQMLKISNNDMAALQTFQAFFPLVNKIRSVDLKGEPVKITIKTEQLGLDGQPLKEADGGIKYKFEQRFKEAIDVDKITVDNNSLKKIFTIYADPTLAGKYFDALAKQALQQTAKKELIAKILDRTKKKNWTKDHDPQSAKSRIIYEMEGYNTYEILFVQRATRHPLLMNTVIDNTDTPIRKEKIQNKENVKKLEAFKDLAVMTRDGLRARVADYQKKQGRQDSFKR